jgi:hypothetical protein
MTLDDRQQKSINLLIAAISALGGIALFMGYIHTKRHSKLQDEILLLDKEIKTLELANKKKQANGQI